MHMCEILPSVLGTIADVLGLFSGLLDCSFFGTNLAIAFSAAGNGSIVLLAGFLLRPSTIRLLSGGFAWLSSGIGTISCWSID